MMGVSTLAEGSAGRSLRLVAYETGRRDRQPARFVLRCDVREGNNPIHLRRSPAICIGEIERDTDANHRHEREDAHDRNARPEEEPMAAADHQDTFIVLQRKMQETILRLALAHDVVCYR